MRASRTEWIFRDEVKSAFLFLKDHIDNDNGLHGLYVNQETYRPTKGDGAVNPSKYKITLEIKRVK